MKLKSENGMVTFIMKAGKDKVRSSMSLAEANRIIEANENVVETETDVVVNDTYYFPIEKETEKPSPKSRKKSNADEVSENE